jgi:hypothetical protein
MVVVEAAMGVMAAVEERALPWFHCSLGLLVAARRIA